MLPRHAFPLALAGFLLGLGVYWLSQPARSSSELTFAVTELEGLETLEREFGAFRDLLSDRSGLPIRFHAVPSRVAATEALAAGQIDLLVVGPAEYVTVSARSAVKILVGLRRPDYHCVFLTRKDKGIGKIQDLKGKTLALGDPGSTSKHLAPLAMLHEAGIQATDLKLVHTGSVRTGWEALIAGDVDAFATTSDKYLAMLERSSPEVRGSVVLLEKGNELPGDVIVARGDLDPAVFGLLRKTLMDDPGSFVTAICTGVENLKYKGTSLIDTVEDRDYDATRAMYRIAGLEHLLQPRGNR